LANSLNAAVQQLDGGNKAGAALQIQTFINQVNLLAQLGGLSTGDAQSLTAAAQAILASL
jgi:hypothetical protein